MTARLEVAGPDRLQLAVVFAGWVMLAWLTPAAMVWDQSWWQDEGVRYRSVSLSFNYFDFGWVRRGLGGTILWLTRMHPLDAMLVFHLLSSLFAAAVFCGLVFRRPMPSGLRLLSVYGVAAMFLFWGEDAGRTDAAIAGLMGLLILAWPGRPVAAALCLVVALALHETGFVLGLALIAALWLDGDRGKPAESVRRDRRRGWLAAGAVVSVAVVLHIVSTRPSERRAEAVATWVWQRFPDSPAAEWAVYYYLSGGRGVQTAVCQNLTLDPNYALHVGCGLLVIGLTVLVFNHRRRGGWMAPLLAGVLPFLFLAAVSIDLARWSALSAINAWLVCIARSPIVHRPVTAADVSRRSLLLCALMVAASPRWLTASGHATYAPMPLLDRAASRDVELASPSAAQGLDHCDPAWREWLPAQWRAVSPAAPAGPR